MLKSLDALQEGFQKISRKSREECGDKLEEMRQFSFLSGVFLGFYHKCVKENQQKYEPWGHSLQHICLLELTRISGHILFLSNNGLYRNAYDDIRHALESIVQALYIDDRHPNTPLGVKIEILKEIEDKREYHAVRLIDELRIAHKDRLKAEYKELSKVIHPSHKQIEVLLHDIITNEEGVPTTVSCEEISNIYESMKRMYDIFFFLVISYFPELEESLKKNSDFIKCIKDNNLTLLASVFKARLSKSSNKKKA